MKTTTLYYSSYFCPLCHLVNIHVQTYNNFWVFTNISWWHISVIWDLDIHWFWWRQPLYSSYFCLTLSLVKIHNWTYNNFLSFYQCIMMTAAATVHISVIWDLDIHWFLPDCWVWMVRLLADPMSSSLCLCTPALCSFCQPDENKKIRGLWLVTLVFLISWPMYHSSHYTCKHLGPYFRS